MPMLMRRVISEDRLDRGIWTAASPPGKATMVLVGCPCFWLWCWLVGALFASALNMNHVLTQESTKVLEVECSGPSSRNADGLHHLTGCPFKRQYSANGLTYRLKVGDFEWQPVACGAIAQSMKKGELESGSLVSFLGNTSGGILKPWIDQDARVCSFADGVSPAPIMVQKAKNDHAIGTSISILLCLGFLTWASSCTFFPDSHGMADDTVWDRCCIIGFLAVLASCFTSALKFHWGDVGMYIGLLIIAVLLFIGYSDTDSWCPSRSAEERDPSEEEPLLPHSSSHPGATPTLPSEAPTPAPGVARSEPEDDPEADGDSESRRKLGDSSGLGAALALGLLGGLLGGIILSVLLSMLLQK